jgi:Uma2 family endonuclease
MPQPRFYREMLMVLTPRALRTKWSRGQAAAGAVRSTLVNRRSQPQRHYSLDEYFAVETDSLVKHEYYGGEIFAMAGASVAHNHVSANVLALLRLGLRGSGCYAFGSDLRIHTPSGLYTYPDVSVICGRVELLTGRPDTATNPVLLVEVLSAATRDYDAGEKFGLYKATPTFREYLLIEPERVRAEQWQLKRGGRWALKTHQRLKAAVKLSSVPAVLPLAEVYREVMIA